MFNKTKLSEVYVILISYKKCYKVVEKSFSDN